MRLRFLVCALPLFALWGLLIGCSTAKNDSQRLKLMTYNIRIGKGGGEWNTDPKKVDLEPVVQLIRRYAPDLVGLQEVDRYRQRTSWMNQPSELSERLGMQIAFAAAYSVKVPSGTNENYGNALLSRFAIQSSERVPLFKPDYRESHPNYPDYYSEQRGLLHATVMIGGKSVHVFVTHLGLTADQRQKQIAEVLEAASRFSGPKIIMGDFNAEPDEPAMQLLANEYHDVLSHAGKTREERRSYPAGTAPKTAIDYIYVSKHFRVLKAEVIRDATLASDHNPVIAEVEF